MYYTWILHLYFTFATPELYFTCNTAVPHLYYVCTLHTDLYHFVLEPEAGTGPLERVHPVAECGHGRLLVPLQVLYPHQDPVLQVLQFPDQSSVYIAHYPGHHLTPAAREHPESGEGDASSVHYRCVGAVELGNAETRMKQLENGNEARKLAVGR